MFLFFFFSSRRRHTRFDCDWSSDVCSSDLEVAAQAVQPHLDRSQPHPLAAAEDATAPGRDLVLGRDRQADGDRKSTRLNSSHSQISYAVFCLKKKKTSIATTSSRRTASARS